nr:S-adenosyl-L-methionine-dependent methyltransferase [Tanacetum cinerariifolium]
MFLEHHGYDLSHCIQTGIDNNDDEIFDVEMEDITCYAASDFVGEEDVVIPNRSISDPFLNKLCNGSYINDFSDKPDIGESSQPCSKELKINSDDEDVGKQFEHLEEQLKDCLTNYGVANGYQLWRMRNDYRSLFVLCGRDLAEGRMRNDYRSLFVLCGRDLAEGRSSGEKGKKEDWPYKKEKDEDELPKKDK